MQFFCSAVCFAGSFFKADVLFYNTFDWFWFGQKLNLKLSIKASLIRPFNTPFYRCVLSDLAFELK